MACALALAGCTPASLGYVTAKDGVYTLTIPERCGMNISRVTVNYDDDDDVDSNLWSATSDAGGAANSVVLFQPNDGYSTEGDPTVIDLARPLSITWVENPGDGLGAVSGVLSTLGPDDVLSQNGITSFDDYERQTVTLAVPGTFRCANDGS